MRTACFCNILAIYFQGQDRINNCGSIDDILIVPTGNILNIRGSLITEYR